MGGARKVYKGGGERTKDLQEGGILTRGKWDKNPCLESCLDWTKEIPGLKGCEMAGEACRGSSMVHRRAEET